MSDDRVDLERIEAFEEAPLVRPHYPRASGYPETPAYDYGYGYGEEEEGLHLRELWRTVRKRKWLILTVAVIITTLVTIEAYRTKSTYRASAFIELGKDETIGGILGPSRVFHGRDRRFVDRLKSPERLLAGSDDVFSGTRGADRRPSRLAPDRARFHPSGKIRNIGLRQLAGRRHFEPGVSLTDGLHEQAVLGITRHNSRAGIASFEDRLPGIKL